LSDAPVINAIVLIPVLYIDMATAISHTLPFYVYVCIYLYMYI